MEGRDGSPTGRPTDLVKRRWRRFGQSGAKLTWGGEAYAVRPEARANPRQLCRNEYTKADLAELRRELLQAHANAGHGQHGLLLGLQLTHSGRFCRPEGAATPLVAYRHPVLDERAGVAGDSAVLSGVALDELLGDFATLAKLADEAGFDFVDVKACHGYLVHELLSGRERPGPYGGSLQGRSRFLLRAIEAVRREAPGLLVGVRLSIFDFHPYGPGPERISRPEPTPHQPFGCSADGLFPDLHEPLQLIDMLKDAGVTLLCSTVGSPYYNPHIQRPASQPPSDGYLTPEDPLVGVSRQMEATGAIKRLHPSLCVVGSGYSYLQEWLPHVAQATVRSGSVDLAGLGRMMLSYPTLPGDVLAGRALDRRHVCRTFSDCTTAPRNGLISGCFPLDAFYERMEQAQELAEIKERIRSAD